jgi:hypothetical protein
VTATTTAPSTGREAARFLNNYARRYAAGAFATPTAGELDRAMQDKRWHWWGDAGGVERVLSRDSVRTDFAGRPYTMHKGARLLTHMAAEPGAAVPSLDGFDWVFAYIEDRDLTAQLKAQYRELHAIRISASSEIIGCWGRIGTGNPYSTVDTATLVRVPLEVPEAARPDILAEVNTVTTWHDDYPFYSDGSWGAVSLRGFNPADPTWGVKPSEMSKRWLAEHPEAARYRTCQWTVAAEQCPAAVALIESVPWWGKLERVRLLRMAGRDGKGGSLSRHTDVTDRAAGTRNGSITRFHIPLTTHPDITMSAWDLDGQRHDVHLPQWSMWYLDARKPHAVDNRAGIDRVHLVVDVVADAEVRSAITNSRILA